MRSLGSAHQRDQVDPFSTVKGFICEGNAIEGTEDITAMGAGGRIWHGIHVRLDKQEHVQFAVNLVLLEGVFGIEGSSGACLGTPPLVQASTPSLAHALYLPKRHEMRLAEA